MVGGRAHRAPGTNEKAGWRNKARGFRTLHRMRVLLLSFFQSKSQDVLGHQTFRVNLSRFFNPAGLLTNLQMTKTTSTNEAAIGTLRGTCQKTWELFAFTAHTSTQTPPPTLPNKIK